MNSWLMIGIGALALFAGASAFGFSTYRTAMNEADAAFSRLAAPSAPPLERFNPEQVAHLPEVAQRYFRHAIAPGTRLYTVAELEMEGKFLLGDSDKHQTFDMSARQVLRAPDQFVWAPKLRSGVTTITGSDALVQGEAWTRFWLLGLVPVAQDRTSSDLVRSAQFRSAVESALTLPPSLLPVNGVHWEQVGEDRARLTFHRFSPVISLDMILEESGAVREVVGQRWSNANADKAFRLQPFGGTMGKERTFQGLTIPTDIAAGNHYGTADYLPFFQARITRVTYR